jgi:hypothetical protein
MRMMLFAGLCAGCIFSCGYLAGAWTTTASVEAAARASLTLFERDINVLTGRVLAMESLCR